MKDSYDVVVIGSGFGGAVTSCRLSQSGRSVAVLERGRQWNRTDFPRSPGQVSEAFWKDGRQFGLLEYKAFKRIDVIQGVGVGGGSLHYYNVHMRAPAEIFQQKPWPQIIHRRLMDNYYQMAETMMESKPLEPPAGRELPERTRAFLQAARAAGKTVDLVPIAVYTGPPRQNPHSGIPQDPCDYSGNCMLGCAQHAKQTLDLNYLPTARQNGAEIFPLHEAVEIEPLQGGGYRVRFQQHDPEHPGRPRAGTVDGRQVVLAAGTLGTNQLLLRCRDVYGKLPNLSPALGTRFSGNGDFLLASTSNTRPRIDLSRGPSITAVADFSTPQHKINIQDVGFAEPLVWLLEGALPSTNRLGNLLRGAKSYLLDSLGIGNGRISFEAERLLGGGSTTHMISYLGMGTDAADGRLRLNRGLIEIDWSHRNSKQMFGQIEDGLRELSRQLGGKYNTSLLWRWPARKLVTAHPLGGCFLGDEAGSSVADQKGEVWGYPGLFVADGSAIPSALAVNPSLTISALAERIAQWMVHGRDVQ